MHATTDTPKTASATDEEGRKHVACTLNDAAFRERRAMVRQSLLPHVLEIRQRETSLVVVFPDTQALRTRVENFAGLERQCCGFLTFTVEPAGEGLTLTVEGPPAARTTLDMLAAVLAGRRTT